jgi:hypothetical protein
MGKLSNLAFAGDAAQLDGIPKILRCHMSESQSLLV